MVAHPVNIKKWFKSFKNIFQAYLNPILWVTKRFLVIVHVVMCRKHFINIM